jgi:hypothetical protein
LTPIHSSYLEKAVALAVEAIEIGSGGENRRQMRKLFSHETAEGASTMFIFSRSSDEQAKEAVDLADKLLRMASELLAEWPQH